MRLCSGFGRRGENESGRKRTFSHNVDDSAEAPDPLRRGPVKQPYREEIPTHPTTHLPSRDWCAESGWSTRRTFSEINVHWVRQPSLQPYWLVVTEIPRIRSLLVVPKDGAFSEWAAAEVGRNLLRLGSHGDVIMTSDLGPVVKDLMEEVAPKRGSTRTIL